MTDGGSGPAAELAAARPVLDVYYRAVSGHPAHLLGRAADDDPVQAPDTGTTIRLPNQVSRFAGARANFDWYKVALTHRAAHHRCGSFDFRLDRPSRLRPRLTSGLDDDLARLDPETDLERVLRSFTYRSLAIEVFTIAEDLRVDATIPARYPGVAPALARVQAAELSARPEPGALPPRSALLELFVRLSLGDRQLPPLPAALHRPAVWLADVAAVLREPSASVEDAVEVAVRAYELITGLPPLTRRPGEPLRVPDPATGMPAPDWRIRLPEPAAIRLEGDSILEASVPAVDYRDLLGWRYGRYGQPGPPGQEAIFSLRAIPGGDDGPGEEPGDDRPAGPPEPLPHEDHEWHVDHYEHVHGGLSVDAAGEHLYPEWDHVQRTYRARWCRVREQTLPPGPSTKVHDETLRAYRDVLPRLVGQLERWAPEGLRLVGRQPDGDDLDLDASIEALVDLRAGRSPDDAIHRRLQRVARDVGVVFLLDLSSSTAERVPPGHTGDDARLARIHGRPYRRIIDVERESVALLLAAVRRTGDAVGVYGFSGTGRADVRFDVVKHLAEPMSRKVASRIENLRPVHTTRMGPAIRHATAKLQTWQASTKLLVLVSDGRPFDRDYGQEYGAGAELEYAVQDTRKALDEARARQVRPFVLTVDTDGHDYLSHLGGDLDAETLSDVTKLPLHLLSLYQRLARG